MKLQRLLRDGAVLIGFVLAFYLLTLLVQNIGPSGTESTAQEVSFDRRQAEQNYTQKDWVQSAIHYESLVKDDPFNSHAWFFLGYSYNAQQVPLYTLVNRELRRTDPDEAKIDRWNEQLKVVMQRAIPPLTRAIDFPRYRNQARFMMAKMYAYHGNRELAFRFLSDALQDGFNSNYRGGIVNGGIFEFKEIRDSKKFIELAELEQENFHMHRRSVQGNQPD
ncbi:MAG: hypothetical protein P8K79_06780 [Mariniblastus sp.]|nr:hypothetical protein [Mariniblastus sp.]